MKLYLIFHECPNDCESTGPQIMEIYKSKDAAKEFLLRIIKDYLTSEEIKEENEWHPYLDCDKYKMKNLGGYIVSNKGSNLYGREDMYWIEEVEVNK